MNEWEHVPDVYCPLCAAKALWAGKREGKARVAYCMRCNSRVVLHLTKEQYLDSTQQAELQRVRALASVDSNSAVGAFG